MAKEEKPQEQPPARPTREQGAPAEEGGPKVPHEIPPSQQPDTVWKGPTKPGRTKGRR